MQRQTHFPFGVLFSVLLAAGLARAAESPPFFFIQLTDPQFGMYAKNADFAKETANFEFAIATANRLKPAFVVVTGDLVNKAGDAAQCDEYLRICAKLDRKIPLFHVAGNHDAGGDRASLDAYRARFGPDHFSFRQGNLLGIVFNTNLCMPKADAELAAAQAGVAESRTGKGDARTRCGTSCCSSTTPGS